MPEARIVRKTFEQGEESDKYDYFDHITTETVVKDARSDRRFVYQLSLTVDGQDPFNPMVELLEVHDCNKCDGSGCRSCVEGKRYDMIYKTFGFGGERSE